MQAATEPTWPPSPVPAVPHAPLVTPRQREPQYPKRERRTPPPPRPETPGHIDEYARGAAS
jgi:hypothetical protein